MDLITVFIFAIGLSFDSFAVSLSCGMSCCSYTLSRALRFATILALSQAVMPLIGWALASKFHTAIQDFDHWIALIILTALGGKMVWDSLSKGDAQPLKEDPFTLRRSVILGIATSIDALIAGVAMAMVPLKVVHASQLTNILISVLIICIVTFTASTLGIKIGKTSRSKIGCHAELIGGVILIAIGLKIVVEHTLL